VKNGARLAALGGAAISGMLVLGACGTDNNAGGGSGAVAKPSGIECATGTINASGSSAQANAISEWTKAFSAACAGATVNYQASGSGAGVQQFTQGSTAFAGSDSALKPEEQPAADKRCANNKAIHLPMVVGPVAVVYNLTGVENLQLSPKTIAGIFAGKITKWNDPAIKKENPSATLPGSTIQSVHRGDESGTTDNFTKFLKETAPELWTYEPGKKWLAPGGQGVKGSDGVATAVKQSQGTISYVEYSYAKNAELGMAKVANGAGEYVELTPESASKAVAGAKAEGEGNDVKLSIDYATKEAGAYPIVLVTYEITCEKGLPADQLKVVKALLTYTASDDGQAVLTKLGYAPLPASIATKVRTAVGALS
jgi:phosphate transport system substrate-binding protein